MIKHATRIVKIGLVFLSLFVAVLLLGIYWFGKYTQEQYFAIVTNREILDPFFLGNKQAIDEVVGRYNLAYQVLYENKVIYSSRPLPEYKVIGIRRKVSEFVLEEELSSSLLKLHPYIVFFSKTFYFVFPLASDNASDKQYLVFAKLLP